MPEGYTAIEYLQSNGNQYIDTGVVPNQDTRIVVDARMTSVATTTAAIFGAGTTATSTSKVVFYQASSGLFAADYATSNTRQVFDGVEALDRLYIDYDKNVCTINGVTRTWASTTFSPDANLTLFCWNANGNLVYYIEAAIYSCKIYDNGTLIRDYVPVETNAGEQGLYDLVANVFYSFQYKAKQENRIYIEYKVVGIYEDSFIRSTYPVASDIVITYEVEVMNDEGYYYVDEVKTLSSGESEIYVAGFDSDTGMGGVALNIISISPTEDDTYIYTF